MSTGDALVTEGLEVRYGDVVALHDVYLRIQPGHVLAVTGASGAGKTSLLWALAGAVSPRAGSVRVGEEPITDRCAAARLGIVLMPQGNGLVSALTAIENILHPLITSRGSVPQARAHAAAALRLVGLEDSANHLIEELSGGQQQRVAAARLLASHGSFLLLDEPTSDLDGANRERVLAALRTRAAAGATVVLATHDPEAAEHADGELALDQGEMTWARPLPDVG